MTPDRPFLLTNKWIYYWKLYKTYVKTWSWWAHRQYSPWPRVYSRYYICVFTFWYQIVLLNFITIQVDEQKALAINKSELEQNKNKWKTTNTVQRDVANFAVGNYAVDFVWQLRTHFGTCLYAFSCRYISYECFDRWFYYRHFFPYNARFLCKHCILYVRLRWPGGRDLETLHV